MDMIDVCLTSEEGSIPFGGAIRKEVVMTKDVMIGKLQELAEERREVYFIKIDGLRENRKFYTIIGPRGRLSGDHRWLKQALEVALHNLEDPNYDPLPYGPAWIEQRKKELEEKVG